MITLNGSPRASMPGGYRQVEVRHWDAVAPVPNKTFKAAITPKAFRLHRRLRRIVLETYLKAAPDSKADSYEQTVVKFLVPMKRFVSSNASRSSENSSNFSHITFFRKNRNSPIKSPKYKEAHSSSEIAFERHDSSSVVSALAANDDGEDVSVDEYDVGWKAKYIFDIEDFIILSHDKDTCLVTTTFAEKDQHRELIFLSEQAASEFCSHVKMRLEIEKVMKDSRLKNMVGYSVPNFNEKIDFLFDIVGAQDLRRNNIAYCNPFVLVKLGERVVHQTDHLENSLNPIWTIQSKSIFVLSVTVKELLLLHEKLELYLYNFGEAQELFGVATVPTSDIFLSNEERKEYVLNDFVGDSQKQDFNKGRIAIRCRRANEYDREILNKAYNESSKHTYKVQESIDDKGESGKESGNVNLTSIVEKKERTITKNGLKVVQYRTRPGPNVTDKMDTEWLTDDEIQSYIYKPSIKWTDVGRGTLGTVFLEVLGCDSLPKRETIGILGNDRDTFVQLIYGDSCSQTDVIDSCRSPRWMPWSIRAFSLHLMNQQTVIYLGVFDYEINQSHTFLGRVAISLVHFHPNTEYLLDYSIHRNSSSFSRTSFGVLKVRLRVQIDHPRLYLLSSIRFAQPLTLNLRDKKQFRTACLTCYGESDQHEPSLRGLAQLIDELWDRFSALTYLKEAIYDVLFWRTEYISPRLLQSPLPILSIVTFVAGLIVLRSPWLIPSTLLGAAVVFLLIRAGRRHSSVNPWTSCAHISELVSALLWNTNFSSKTIAADSMCKHEVTDLSTIDQSDLKPSVDKIISTDTSDDIALSRIIVHTVYPNLYRLQQMLLTGMEWTRVAERVLTWEETFLSFWVSLLLALTTVTFIFISWSIILRWTSTVLVWLLLSPFMKLIDVLFIQSVELSGDQPDPIWKQIFRMPLLEYRLRLRRKEEDETKLKDMKASIFGRYSIRMSRFTVDRLTDVPLASSSATPFKASPVFLADLCLRETGLDKIRKHGQYLVGSIIPQIEKAFELIAPMGQVARQQYLYLLSKNDPAASLSSDSVFAAAMKLFTLIIVSVITTWVAVPTLKFFTEQMTGKLYKALFYVTIGMK